MIDVVAAAIFISQRQGADANEPLHRLCFLSVRRAEGSGGAGDWEFPGGKIEPGESQEQALLREIDEELSLKIRIHRKLGDTIVNYPQKQIHLHLYLCSTDSKNLKLVDHDAHEWLYPADFSKLHWSKGDLDFMKCFNVLEAKQ